MKAIEEHLSIIQQKLKNHAFRDIWNADEFGLLHRMAPDFNIAEGALRGHEEDQTRITYLACANADGSEGFPLMVIDKADRPRPFKKKYWHQLKFDYWNTEKAHMTGMLLLIGSSGSSLTLPRNRIEKLFFYWITAV